MGAALTHGADRVIEPGRPLRLRYGMYVHAGKPAPERLEARWAEFARGELPDLVAKKK